MKILLFIIATAIIGILISTTFPSQTSELNLQSKNHSKIAADSSKEQKKLTNFANNRSQNTQKINREISQIKSHELNLNPNISHLQNNSESDQSTHSEKQNATLAQSQDESSFSDKNLKAFLKEKKIKNLQDLLDKQIQQGNYNYALWTAKDLYQINPSEELLSEIKELSVDAYSKADQLEANGEILLAGDYFDALRWAYEDQLGQTFEMDNLHSRLQTIESNDLYYQLMLQRANQQFQTAKNNPEAYAPFWDYLKIAKSDKTHLKKKEFKQNLLVSMQLLVKLHIQSGNYKEMTKIVSHFKKTFPKLALDKRTIGFLNKVE